MLNKSELLLVILIFYAFIGLIFGLIGTTLNVDLQDDIGSIDSKSLGFFANVVNNYEILPPAFKIILFTPLVAVLGFIIISSLPTFNGGG